MVGTAGGGCRSVVGGIEPERSHVGIHGLVVGEHGGGGLADEVVGEGPDVRRRIHETGVRCLVERVHGVVAFPADHRDQVGDRPFHTQDGREGDDVAMLGRQPGQRSLDQMIEGADIARTRRAGDRPRQQQRVAAGEPGERGHQPVTVEMSSVRGQQGGGVVLAEGVERDHGCVPLQLGERLADLRRSLRSGTAGDEDHQRRAVEGSDHESRQQRRCDIGQVGVIEHDRGRLPARARAEHVGEGGEPGEPIGVDADSPTLVGEHIVGFRTDELGEHGRPGPERRCTSVRPATTPRHGEAVACRRCRGVLAERRLADAGRAADDHQLATAAPSRGRDFGDQGQFALAAHKTAVGQDAVGSHPPDGTARCR